MKLPTLSEIDQIRNEGSRPQIVGCFLSDKKVLFLFKKAHNLWQLPQGGIDNRETAEAAFFREMGEELGSEFVKTCDKDIMLFAKDTVSFPAHSQNSRDLKNDAGEDIFMKGKKYFFIYAKTKSATLDISKSEFDKFKWVSLEEGLILCDMIYQKGKKRITRSALQTLREQNLI